MIDFAPLLYRVEPMRPEDIAAVMDIERVAFTAPWSERAFSYELQFNEMAHYYVARPQSMRALTDAPTAARKSLRQRLFTSESSRRSDEDAPLVGYGGFWEMVGEAHISTIAVASEWRRRGIGELLLVAMIDAAAEIGARVVTLEVRVSNLGAQALYRKYDFQVVGQRKHYYIDNGEDAYIMTTPRILSASFNGRFQELKTALFKRLSG